MRDDVICKISLIVASLGAILWSLVTVAGVNPVSAIFGKTGYRDFWRKAFAPTDPFARFFEYSPVERLIYLLIGIAGAVSLRCALQK